MRFRSAVVLCVVLTLAIVSSCATTVAVHDQRQPHMRAALEALQTAKAELEAAEHNKGGHREKALELVKAAIEQTKKGVEFGEREM